MGEEVIPAAGAANNPGAGNGTDPAKTDNPAPKFDASKLGDDDLGKVLEDPRVYKHSRFKNLQDRAKLADKLEAEAKEANENKLKEEKKFSELADLRTKERDEVKGKFAKATQDNAIIIAASRLGVVDLDVVKQLIDRSGLTVNDDGTVAGAEEAVKALIEAKPFLKGKPGSVTIGSPTAPGAEDVGIKKFKLSQLRDPVFFKANEKEIMIAQKNGQLENDVS